MKKLIKALKIFLKYGNPKYPTYCSHECLYVEIDPKLVSEDDIKKLRKLGFNPGEEDCEEFSGGFYSFHYGG